MSQSIKRKEDVIGEIIELDMSIDQLKKRWDTLDENELEKYEALEEKKHTLLQSLIA